MRVKNPASYFFDLGVRNAAAGLPLHQDIVNADPGRLFEHFVANQIHRLLSYAGKGLLSYYRTTDGAEVDFVVELIDRILPIEVKWTEQPDAHSLRHIKSLKATAYCGRSASSQGPAFLKERAP